MEAEDEEKAGRRKGEARREAGNQQAGGERGCPCGGLCGCECMWVWLYMWGEHKEDDEERGKKICLSFALKLALTLTHAGPCIYSLEDLGEVDKPPFTYKQDMCMCMHVRVIRLYLLSHNLARFFFLYVGINAFSALLLHQHHQHTHTHTQVAKQEHEYLSPSFLLFNISSRTHYY